MTALVLIAKEPIAGRVKTRLHPPLTLHQAARLASAAIDDTLAAIADLPASRRVLLYDGDRTPDSADGYEVIRQVDGPLDERLAALFDTSEGPTILIGMDTPQLRAADLAPAFAWPDEVDAWFGPASDGGYWAIGMREPRGELIRGIPMSRDDTGARQLARLHGADLRVGVLPTLIDVDDIADARDVAGLAPDTAFARLLTEFDLTLVRPA